MQNLEAPDSQRALVISPNALLAEELSPLLKERPEIGRLHGLSAYPTLSDFVQTATEGVQTLFLDVSSDGHVAMELLQEAGRLGRQLRVVALLAHNEPDLILRCLRSGAAEFLVHPFTAEQVEAALGKLARLQTTAEGGANEPAKIFAVMPAKGACGATTVASNLALQWKKVTGKRVLLADLDPQTGNLSFILKAKSTFSFLDTLQRAHELDHDLWKAMVTQVDGIDVLLAPDLMPEGTAGLRDPAPILEYARHSYDAVILDCSGVYGEWNLNAARHATEILLVTTNELPALQAAQRALSYLDSNRIGRWKIRLLVNRYLLDVGLSREVIGTALHSEVFATLPSDYEAVQKALIEGRTIPASSALGKGVAQLVTQLGGKPIVVKDAAPPKKTNSLSGLFGLFSKSK